MQLALHLATIECKNLLANVRDRGEQLREGLRAIAQKYPDHAAEVRGSGLIDGLEIKADSPLTSPDVVKVAMAKGLLLVPAGLKVVRFVRPLIVTEAKIDQALGAVKQAFASL